MSLAVVINGLRHDYFISYEVSRSVEDIAGSFTIEMTNKAGKDPDVKIGQAIQILINNTPVLTGYVEKLKISYADNSHTITFSGRDKVADFVDSTIGHNIELKAPITLEQIINKVMSEIKMTGVPIHNQAGTLAPFITGDLVSGQIDETIFDFLEKYTRKRQVLMTTDGKGGLVLARAGAKQADVPLVHQMDNTRRQNNIKEASLDWDDTERFHTYRIHSQGNPSASSKLGTANNKELVTRTGTAFDNDIRPTRILDLTAESSTDTATLKKRAEWEAVVRLARGFKYECTIFGHTMKPNGNPWEPNMKAHVFDEFGLVDEPLIIKSVKYSLSISGGTTTELQLVDPDSYKPEPIVEKKRKGKKIGRKKKGRKSGLINAEQKFLDRI